LTKGDIDRLIMTSGAAPNCLSSSYSPGGSRRR